MSNCTSSSNEIKFVHPEYFIQSGSQDEWFCNICTPLNSGKVGYMTLKMAQYHEQHSGEHAHNVIKIEREQWMLGEPDPEAWDEPRKNESGLTKEEIKMRESQLHVDLVRDMVPFWIRGMEAAERGEVLRLEEFLATLETTSGSETSGDEDGWETGGGGWGNGEVGYGKEKYSCWSGAYQFVEDVAQLEAADEERRRRMHNFFEMPTDEKVKKIAEVIRTLVQVTS